MIRKQTFFQMLYFIITRFLYFGFFGLIFSYLIELLERNNDKSHFPFLNILLLNLSSKIIEFGHILKLLSMMLLMIAASLIIFEIVHRLMGLL